MKQKIVDYLLSNKHNYNTLVNLRLQFGDCQSVLDELENEGRVVKRQGLNHILYKIK